MDTIIEVKPQEMLGKVAELREQGCRLVQIMCSMANEQFELTYNFDKKCTLTNLRCFVSQGEAMRSITEQFWYAFIWENEIHDLFGLKFQNILEGLDFQGRFFRMTEQFPWNPNNGVDLGKVKGIDASVTNAGGEKNA